MDMSNKISITAEKLQSLKERLQELIKKKKDLGEHLEQARLHDVSEDTDSINAVVTELQKIDQKIAETNDTLSNAEVLKKTKAKNKIEVGSEVTVKVKGKTVKYTIVSDVEADPLENKISDISPVGKSLLGKKKGDKIDVNVGEKPVTYEIVRID
jgi:transcription elongation factor GreA